MKVLFISSGNSNQGISPIVKNQGDSLKKVKVKVDYYRITGNGILGYLKNVIPLYKYIRRNKPDLLHAHYSLCGIVTALTFQHPLVVSLMGSDVNNKGRNLFIKSFIRYFWNFTIVKSRSMQKTLGLNTVKVLPNGVSFDRFFEMDKISAQKELNWSTKKKHILFAANPSRPEKNYQLAIDAMRLLDDENIELHYLEDVPNEEMAVYYNAADVVLLTSTREGSPNVIKEAMACNAPIVATSVGDIEEVIGNTAGCFLVSFNEKDVAEKLSKALAKNDRTNGREQILHLKDEEIAFQLLTEYQRLLV